MAEVGPKFVFWIATVGGTPAPLVASLKHWMPEKVLFLPSKQSVSQIEDILTQAREGTYLSPGQHETILLPDAQDPTSCIQIMAESLRQRIQEWLARGDDYGIVIDWTGGTKTMSAALALVAHKWNNTYFSYVGGTSRNKEGIGVVESGSETVYICVNSWESLGYKVIEDALYAYEHGAFQEGSNRLRAVLRQIDQGDQTLKSEISTLASFMEGVDAWDKCDYRKAKGCYEHCNRKFNDLKAILHLNANHDATLKKHIRQALDHLKNLQAREGQRTVLQCHDLLANARRRKEEGRYVDAVARLYHAIEALGQVQLETEWNLEASRVPVNALPCALQATWKPRQDEDSRVKLGLQGVYEVLATLGDPLGKTFQEELRWHAKDSPLSRRNRSIAGHGFESVKASDCEELWMGALKLAGIEDTENDLICFPRLDIGFAAIE